MTRRPDLPSPSDSGTGSESTVGGAIDDLARVFAAAGVDAPRREAQLLVGHVAGLDRAQLTGRPERILSAAEGVALADLAGRRAAREPFAYLVGNQEFWSLNFKVTADTLIPRPESEAVIEAVLDRLADRRASLRLLDLGTGSGCLLLALLSELPAAAGIGVDSSWPACAVARDNAEALGLAARAAFLSGDWVEAVVGRFDVIVANPPYVPTKDAGALEPEIVDYEPAGAVFAGREGLDAYHVILPQLSRLLVVNGMAVIELGADQADSVRMIAEGSGLAVSGERPDLAGRRRCLCLTVETPQ